jgi:hypothetical protein
MHSPMPSGTVQRLGSTPYQAGDTSGGSNIGPSAAATVDKYQFFEVYETTPGQTIGLWPPTNTTVGFVVYVTATNLGFNMYGVAVSSGGSQGFVWSPTLLNYIPLP